MFGSQIHRLVKTRRDRRSQSLITSAARSPLCEGLEPRWLMATFSWDIAWTGTTPTSARFEPVSTQPGQVAVFLNTNTTQTPDYTFANTSSLDIIDSGNLANFTFIDRVPAALKPKEGASGGGIQVVSDAGSATLRIEGTTDDRAYTVLSSTSTETVVRITDITTDTGRAVMGVGVTKLVIEPNPVSAGTVNSDDFNLLANNFGQTFFFGGPDWEDLLKRLENGEHPMM